MEVARLNQLLAQQHGSRAWHSHGAPLSELIATILSQNTSDVNSGRAFSSLTGRFGSWEEVARADISEIEQSIRSGGLSRVKAARIKEILQKILNDRGSLDLSFLESVSVEEAKEWLKALPGVGAKTASCVLLFSLGRPVFPVDTHVFRLSKRLGLISNGVNAEKAHELMTEMVASEYVYQLHLNMVEHGRHVCRSRNPKCWECIIGEICPSYQAFFVRGLHGEG
ncbi:MAG: endonuclease III [Dehalococcoidia bacterium]